MGKGDPRSFGSNNGAWEQWQRKKREERERNEYYAQRAQLEAEAAQQNAAQQEAEQQRAGRVEAARLAAIEAARIAEAAAQAEAVRLLEESARVTAQAAVAQQAVQAATQQVAQLESQLLTAQTVTQEAIQFTQQCAAQRAEVERTLETVNERVTKTVTQYMTILDEAKKHAAICIPGATQDSHASAAAGKFLRESSHIRAAARITAEHAKLQQTTVLELQKANDELAQLTQQQVMQRTTAQDQTRAAIDRASQTMVNLTAEQLVVQQAAVTANTQLMAVIHRVASQQADAQQRATIAAQQTATPLRPEVAVDPALSRQLIELQTRLVATQVKIQQTNQALTQIMEMEAEAQDKKINCVPQTDLSMTNTFTNTLKYLMQEYLLRKEQVELEQKGSPLAEQLAIAMTQIVAAKETLKAAEAAWLPLARAGTPRFKTLTESMHPLALAWTHAGLAYQGALEIAYQALLQRRAEKMVQQTQGDVRQLAEQHIELTEKIKKLTDTGADQTEILVATQRMTELLPRLTKAEATAEEAQKEVACLTKQDAIAKYHAEKMSNQRRGMFATRIAMTRINEQHKTLAEKQQAAVIQKSILDKADLLDLGWYQEYLNTMTQAIDNQSIYLSESPDSGYQATLQTIQSNISRILPPPESVPACKSLELLFQCDLSKFPSFADNTLHPAIQLLMSDLLYILIYHAPTIYHHASKVLSDTISNKALFYIQHFLSTHTELYQNALSRMLKRLDAGLYTMASQISPTTQLPDITVNGGSSRGMSGWQLMESARVNLQMKAQFAQKRNHRFFSVTPEFRDQSNYAHHSRIDQENALFCDWMKSIDATADSINLLDLPADMLKEIKTMSDALHQTATVQAIRPK